jgi:spore coat polysaccharide biosynthesis protein SpsF
VPIKNKIDVIVEARMTSSRLPGKILLTACGIPLLQLMIERLKRIDLVNGIIVATTTNKSDDVIVSLCSQLDINCFRGDENDVLGRVVEAAQQYKTDIIVEITSDNPLIDPHLCNDIIKKYLELDPNIDFVSNDVGCYRDDVKVTFPLGLCNTKVFRRTLLEKVAKTTSNAVDREHVVNNIVNNPGKYSLFNVNAKKIYNRSDIRLTLDYPEDYKVIKSVFEALYPLNPDFTADDIVSYLDENKKIKSLNKNCVQQKYKY